MDAPQGQGLCLIHRCFSSGQERACSRCSERQEWSEAVKFCDNALRGSWEMLSLCPFAEGTRHWVSPLHPDSPATTSAVVYPTPHPQTYLWNTGPSKSKSLENLKDWAAMALVNRSWLLSAVLVDCLLFHTYNLFSAHTPSSETGTIVSPLHGLKQSKTKESLMRLNDLQPTSKWRRPNTMIATEIAWSKPGYQLE
jgi:hypothetical protein